MHVSVYVCDGSVETKNENEIKMIACQRIKCLNIKMMKVKKQQQ